VIAVLQQSTEAKAVKNLFSSEHAEYEAHEINVYFYVKNCTYVRCNYSMCTDIYSSLIQTGSLPWMMCVGRHAKKYTRIVRLNYRILRLLVLLSYLLHHNAQNKQYQRTR
jgi:hypothetical protein